MPSQVLTTQTLGVDTFVALLRAHAEVTRELNGRLSAQHGLTLSDFEVLLRLARAPERRLRRVDLATQVLLTASGITRLLDGLERQGYVERAACDSDRRVVYAVLTDRGLEKLVEAAATHFAEVEALFGSRFDDAELDELGALLTRLTSDGTPDCAAPDEAAA